MGESYAGITVPEGEPGELRSAGQALSGASGALEGVAAELRGMPGMLGSWQGPASVNYAGSCLTNGAAVDSGMEALQSCSTAIKRYADELEAARDDAGAAIEDAKDAQRRIKLAGAAIEDAQARATAATDSFAVASARVVATGLTGSPAPDALADQSAAEQAISDAQADETGARRQLEAAEEDLRRAQERGRKAEEAARDAAQAATGAFGATGAGSPAVASYGSPGSPAVGGTGLPSYVDPLAGTLFGAGEWTSRYASQNWVRYAPGFWTRPPRYVSPYTRSTPSGGTSRVSGYWRSGAWTSAREVPDLAARAKWAGRASTLGRAGAVASFATAGIDQWMTDSSDPSLETSERVGRTAAQTATVGGASALGGWGGAAGGAAIGTAIVPGVGTVVGGVVGGVVGSGGAGWVADEFNDSVVDFAGDAANTIEDGLDDAGEVLDSLNPF